MKEDSSSSSSVTEKRLMRMKKSDLINWLDKHNVDVPAKSQLKEYYLGLALKKHAELGGDKTHRDSIVKRRGSRRRSKSPYPVRPSFGSRIRGRLSSARTRITAFRFGFGAGGFWSGRRRLFRILFFTIVCLGAAAYLFHIRDLQRRRMWWWQR